MAKVQIPNYTMDDYICMPHGKVQDTSLPPDWEKYVGDNLSKWTRLENGDSVVDGPFGSPLTVTTVPPRPPSGEEDPAGHTEFFYLSEETRAKVFNFPGFPQPVIKPKVPRHEVREAPGKGLGVYATCDLYPGDLIWAERPFVVTSSAMVPPNGTHIGDHHTVAQGNALRLYAGERTVEEIVNRLTPERKARFMSLANAHTEDGSGPVSGIMRTNQLSIRMVEGDPKGEKKPRDMFWKYTAVADDLSRTNHSCVANIDYTFDFASFSIRIYAFNRIKKGDELVWSYIDSDPNPAVRAKELSPYGFRCKCRLCTDQEAQYLCNTFHDRSYLYCKSYMVSLLKEDLDDPFHLKSPAAKARRMAEYQKWTKPLEIFRQECEEYGLEGEMRVLCLLHEIYKRLGNEPKRRRTASLVTRWIFLDDLAHRPWL